ncbi:hypothetical protein EVAR_6432_1 [Eumeta japonica]|uniref:Uncharacterized protein n=1 Tax=Eumeta variegata TaxID=151549 RepID=A0A4C1TDS2_EUMVA|nr:hypothetical protein EVAR_6432_1 [Eumeta japonica]
MKFKVGQEVEFGAEIKNVTGVETGVENEVEGQGLRVTNNPCQRRDANVLDPWVRRRTYVSERIPLSFISTDHVANYHPDLLPGLDMEFDEI